MIGATAGFGVLDGGEDGRKWPTAPSPVSVNHTQVAPRAGDDPVGR